MKVRNGTATVSVEASCKTKVGHWVFPEKAVWVLMIRKSGNLLKCVIYFDLRYKGRLDIYVCRNFGCSSPFRIAAAFLLYSCQKTVILTHNQVPNHPAIAIERT